jgi:hypothetical protein
LFREVETVQAAQTVQTVQAPFFILPRVARVAGEEEERDDLER